jgi:hypothetical protein
MILYMDNICGALVGAAWSKIFQVGVSIRLLWVIRILMDPIAQASHAQWIQNPMD